jgi:hypothetical protein
MGAFVKGEPNTLGGRPKGSVNKSTRDARADIADFVNGNAHRLIGWLDKIAEENPMAAFDRYMSVVEYHIPKLQRQEITGKDGERLQLNVVTGVTIPAIDAAYTEVVQPVPLISEKVTEDDGSP